MSQSDSTFFKPFAFVLGALVLFTLFIAFIANLASPESPDDPLAVAERQNQIQPIGRVRVVGGTAEEAVSEEAVSEEASQAETSTSESDSTESATTESVTTGEVSTDGETNTDQAAVEEPGASEEAGNASAVTESEPAAESSATADAAATAPVMMTAEQMAEVPVNVRAAVATNCAGCHNDGLHGAAKPDDAEAWSALAGQGIDTLTMSVINGKGKMPARAESRLADDEIRQAVELMIWKATGGVASAASAATGEGTATSTSAVAATQADTQASTDDTETTTAQAGQAGQAVPDEVKQVVDSACAACHSAGVANAPKFGDKDAWAKRMEVGIDALAASAIAGKGVMPPRGGSQLDDEQIKLAIEYMMSK